MNRCSVSVALKCWIHRNRYFFFKSIFNFRHFLFWFFNSQFNIGFWFLYCHLLIWFWQCLNFIWLIIFWQLNASLLVEVLISYHKRHFSPQEVGLLQMYMHIYIVCFCIPWRSLSATVTPQNKNKKFHQLVKLCKTRHHSKCLIGIN